MMLGIIQARMGSIRFPGKVMAKICGMPLIELVVKRCQRAKLVDQWVIATTQNIEDDVLGQFGVPLFRGPTENVLERFYLCAQSYHLEPNDVVVRITSDDPLREPKLMDECVSSLVAAEYWSIDGGALGVGSEAFWMRTLVKAFHSAKSDYEKEHVTIWMRNHVVGHTLYSPPSFGLTIDYPADLERIEKLIGSRDPVTIDYRELMSETT